MVDYVAVYERKISSKDFVLELRNLFDKLHNQNPNTPENTYIKPIVLSPLQALGLEEISVENVLANSPIELIKALSPYPDTLKSLNDLLHNQLNKSAKDELTEEKAFEIEKLFLSELLTTFEHFSKNRTKEDRKERDKKLAPIKNSINHLFQYLGATNQPIIDLNKLAINGYKDENYYSRKLGINITDAITTHVSQNKITNESTSSFAINKAYDTENSDYVDHIIQEKDNQKKFPSSLYQSQITRLKNDAIAYYMSQVISFGEGSNAWRGSFLFLSALTAGTLGIAPSLLVLGIPVVAGYCSQQVNQALFYVSIKETFNKFSEGLFKKSNGEEITNFWDLTLLGGAISVSLCAAFALTGILQFSSTLTFFNLLFNALPTTISIMLPEMLPTILSASIAAFSFVGFSSIFSLSFIEKTKDYIEEKEAEENKDSLFTQITKLFVTGCAVSAHAFMCITSVDSLPGIKEYATLSKALILIAELPFSTFLYNGISSFIDIIMDSLDSAANNINSFINGSNDEQEELNNKKFSPVYQAMMEENDNTRSALQKELPVNSIANSLVFGYGIFGTVSNMFPHASIELVTSLAAGGAMAIFSGSYGNNNGAIIATTETPEPIRFVA